MPFYFSVGKNALVGYRVAAILSVLIDFLLCFPIGYSIVVQRHAMPDLSLHRGLVGRLPNIPHLSRAVTAQGVTGIQSELGRLVIALSYSFINHWIYEHPNRY